MPILFNTSDTIARSILRYADWNYVRAGLQRNLTNIKNYYNSRVMSVKSNHLLCRIINTADISHNLEIERYYDILDSNANRISNAMFMTSPVSKGRLFDGFFYGQGCIEVIISNNESFDPVVAYKNWKTISPVTVLLHPRTDLEMLLPNGKETSSEKGLCIISINIPMLLIQYRGFVDEQLYLDTTDGTGLQTVAHFVHRFVLPGMLDTHLDLAIFNRLTKVANGEIMGTVYKKHPFGQVDYSNKVTAIHERMVQDFKQRTMEYAGILEMIPAVVCNSMLQALKLPDIAPTRQIVWVELIARLDALLTIVHLGGAESIKLNMSTLNAFALEYRLSQRDRVLSSALPKDILFNTFEKMNELSTIAGRPLLSY